jgi:hypothetical protein
MTPSKWSTVHVAPPTLQKRLEVAEAIRMLAAERENEAAPRCDAAGRRDFAAVQRDLAALERVIDEACRKAAAIIVESLAHERALREQTWRSNPSAEDTGTPTSSALLKAGVDDPKHPGWPAHTPGGLGGQFRPKDGEGGAVSNAAAGATADGGSGDRRTTDDGGVVDTPLTPRGRVAADVYYPAPPPGFDHDRLVLPSYDPNDQNYHHYEHDTIICRQSAGCTPEAVFQGLLRNAAPGQTGISYDGNMVEVTFAGQSAGTIRQNVDEANLTVYNITESGHIFYPGHVARSVVVEKGFVMVRSVGEGIGNYPLFNKEIAEPAFTIQDLKIKHYILTHGQGGN